MPLLFLVHQGFNLCEISVMNSIDFFAYFQTCMKALYRQIHAWLRYVPLLKLTFPFSLTSISLNFYSLSWTLTHCRGTRYFIWICSYNDELTRNALCHLSCFERNSSPCFVLSSSCENCLGVMTWNRPCLKRLMMPLMITREVANFDLFGSLTTVLTSWSVFLVSCSF